MKSGIPWHVKGVRQHARETAREAARRSGMSVGEWLDTVIIDSAVEKGIEPRRSTHGERAPDDFGEQDEDAWPAHHTHDERYPDHDEVVRPQRPYAETTNRPAATPTRRMHPPHSQSPVRTPPSPPTAPRIRPWSTTASRRSIIASIA